MVLKVQTTSAKYAENGLLWARWSAFWDIPCDGRLACALVGTWLGVFAVRCRASLEREPALPHMGRLFRIRAWLPRLGIAG